MRLEIRAHGFEITAHQDKDKDTIVLEINHTIKIENETPPFLGRWFTACGAMARVISYNPTTTRYHGRIFNGKTWDDCVWYAIGSHQSQALFDLTERVREGGSIIFPPDECSTGPENPV